MLITNCEQHIQKHSNFKEGFNFVLMHVALSLRLKALATQRPRRELADILRQVAGAIGAAGVVWVHYIRSREDISAISLCGRYTGDGGNELEPHSH